MIENLLTGLQPFIQVSHEALQPDEQGRTGLDGVDGAYRLLQKLRPQVEMINMVYMMGDDHAPLRYPDGSFNVLGAQMNYRSDPALATPYGYDPARERIDHVIIRRHFAAEPPHIEQVRQAGINVRSFAPSNTGLHSSTMIRNALTGKASLSELAALPAAELLFILRHGMYGSARNPDLNLLRQWAGID